MTSLILKMQARHVKTTCSRNCYSIRVLLGLYAIYVGRPRSSQLCIECLRCPRFADGNLEQTLGAEQNRRT